MHWDTALIAAILGAILAVREWQNWKDRKDLLDRIFSADFKEYKRLTSPPRSPGANVRMSDEDLALAERKAAAGK